MMGIKIAAHEHWVGEPQTILTFLRNTPVDISLLEEFQLIQTLLDGIERMVTATIATDTIPSLESRCAERTRAIREQLQLLSNEISEIINVPPNTLA